ncbi:MAG: prepilin-type N-terminal cleavage/methylation domain-containing protein [Gammaproteobacteria bacterium]|jgi:prepilin-type N-terminal cleavage/methylation domain-containing protein|nr:prepilin-type N-terminal cleavage/methylation domain-containing protein [Gammaproteobacteria bacterium]
MFHRYRTRGLTLVELMIAVAIIGVLAAISIPAYQTYVRRAASVDGYLQFAAVKTKIVDFYVSKGVLPANFEDIGLPPPTGVAHGGDSGSYAHVFGVESKVWGSVEYQPKQPNGYVFVLRAIEAPDIGLHFQIKAENGGVRIRCTINQVAERAPYVPAQCRDGSVDDWSW